MKQLRLSEEDIKKHRAGFVDNYLAKFNGKEPSPEQLLEHLLGDGMTTIDTLRDFLICADYYKKLKDAIHSPRSKDIVSDLAKDYDMDAGQIQNIISKKLGVNRKFSYESVTIKDPPHESPTT